MVVIQFTGKYASMLANLLEKQPDLEFTVDECVEYFRNSPQDTRLDVHALRKKMNGKYSFSITEDVRIVFEWVRKSTARFLAIGFHHEVYKNKN